VLAHCTLHVHGGWDDPELRAAAEEAVVIAGQAGDAAIEAAALITLASAEPVGDNVERIRALLARARAIATRAEAFQQMIEAATIESEILEGFGLHEAAAAVAREGLTAAREHGLTGRNGTVLAGDLAEPLVALGRWDEAAEIIDRALQLFAQRVYRTYLWRLAGDIALARGDLAAAAECVASIRAVLDDTRYLDQYHLPLVRLETDLALAQARPAEAWSVVQDALDRFDVLPSPRYTWPLLVAGARACAAITVRDDMLLAKATALRDRLRAVAGKLTAEGLVQRAHQLTFAAEVARATRTLAAEPGELPPLADMCAAWDEAAQAWEAAGEPYALAAVLLRSAEAALGAGDREGGTTRLRRAAELAQRTGARPLSDDIAMLARRARITLDQPGDAAAVPAAPGQADQTQVSEPDRMGLTVRELDVLRLVAAGRSNREIADELFISVKTASVHVSNILAKLGVRGRGEAAATAHRLRLLDSFPS
jgi:DNA-binding CsgD family transcriptional regulator